MPSTITLVVPRAKNESVFLQLVIQAAIRAYRDDHPTSHKVKTEPVNDDRSRAFRFAVPDAPIFAASASFCVSPRPVDGCQNVASNEPDGKRRDEAGQVEIVPHHLVPFFGQ